MKFPYPLFVLLVALSACGERNPESTIKKEAAVSPQLPEFDSLWNYDDPTGTEAKFRELLPGAQAAGDSGYLAELLTQIARAQGLQQKFADANATLDQADALTQPDHPDHPEMKTARVRILLERGRGLNSSGKPEESIRYFKDALKLAGDAGLEFHAVDSVHMLGIATKGEESLRWNEEAIRMSEAAKDPRARRWLGPLYNNTGWTYFDLRRYDDALKMFQKDLAFRTPSGNKVEIGIARWSAAKVLRYLGRVDEALKIQMELLQLPELKGGDNEGYTREEIGECLILLGRQAEAVPHFAIAWQLLHDDPWLKRDEPKRLDRLKTLGEVK
jgi:tetratricopeptide (TPR) repeat protein